MAHLGIVPILRISRTRVCLVPSARSLLHPGRVQAGAPASGSVGLFGVLGFVGLVVECSFFFAFLGLVWV